MNSFFPNVIFNSNVFFIIFTLLLLVYSPSIANAQDQEGEQRIINKIPKHIPLKVEVVSGDLNTELKNIKIKVTNTGEKPIYYLRLDLNVGDDFKTEDGVELGLTTFRYGKNRMGYFTSVADDEDIPLKPDDFVVFDVPNGQAEAASEYINKRQFKRNPKLVLEFQFIGFGDKTGFFGKTGGIFPSKQKTSKILQKYNFDSKGFFLTF